MSPKLPLPSGMSIVYDQQLKDLLKDCSRSMKIHYEGTKVGAFGCSEGAFIELSAE